MRNGSPNSQDFLSRKRSKEMILVFEIAFAQGFNLEYGLGIVFLGSDSDLHSCFERFPVEPQLAAAEERLRKLAEQGGWTVESRRRLYTLQVAARSFRMFLLGKTEGEVALSVRDELEKLSHVGGPLEPGRFGPRIKKVFDSLR